MIFTGFEHLPANEAYENLDKTKWSKFQHSKIMSAFWDKESPIDEYKIIIEEVGFQIDTLTLFEDLNLLFPNEENLRSKSFR